MKVWKQLYFECYNSNFWQTTMFGLLSMDSIVRQPHEFDWSPVRLRRMLVNASPKSLHLGVLWLTRCTLPPKNALSTFSSVVQLASPAKLWPSASSHGGAKATRNPKHQVLKKRCASWIIDSQTRSQKKTVARDLRQDI